MEPSIALHIENRLPPLTESACNQLRQNGTGPVSDSCPEAVVIGSTLQPLDNYPCTVGLALPVDAGPADNLTVWSCLKFARPGDVLLVSTEECMETSVFGDLLVGFAKNGGIAAMITDGCIRDLNGIKATGLPVYTAGTSPRAPKKNGPGKIGHPLKLCGVEIERDMIVVCDRDGIVAFKQEYLESTLKKLEAVSIKEAKAAQEIADRRTLPTWIEPMIETIQFTD
jgi:4-hydroxy-4-methyl-2-oxoglutarate aldolase